MIEKYRKLKEEEDRRALVYKERDQIQAIADLTDIDLEDPTQGLSLKERINDLEIAICELLDAMA